uniref:Iron-sulfur cluster assembly enzyme b n=1 Tax=Paramormyrops kingsleyae TaxID=1676925 RepID=A0A3B3TAN0_9TELE
MAGLALRRCVSPAVYLNRRLSAPDLSVGCSYHKKVVDHYENPRNVGSLDKNAKNVGTGLVGAPACGDVMKLQIEVDDQGKIVDARFKTFGCGSAIASSSLATEWVKGKSVSGLVSCSHLVFFLSDFTSSLFYALAFFSVSSVAFVYLLPYPVSTLLFLHSLGTDIVFLARRLMKP